MVVALLTVLTSAFLIQKTRQEIKKLDDDDLVDNRPGVTDARTQLSL